MASIARRGDAWRASVARKGKRITATFDTQAEAEAWAIKREADIFNGVDAPKLAIARPGGLTVDSLFARYAAVVSPTKGGARWEKIRLLSLAATFPAFRLPVSEFKAPVVAAWRDERLASVATSTVNRELTLISAVLRHARKEWGITGLDPNPVHEIQRPRDPDARTRRISPAERKMIVRQLGWKGDREPKGAEQWIAWSFCLALETAMRKGEILALTWPHVKLDQLTLHLPKTKNGYARDVPLSTAAIALFGLLKPGAGAVVPVASGTFDTLFRRAKAAAHLTDMNFHDARREATTMFAEKLGILELSAVTGHRSVDLLRKVYYRPDVTALAKKLG